MLQETPTVVIGAGPYGLSAAAHLRARGIPTLIFGKPMSFWSDMPDGMYLKSVLSASSLSDPTGKYTIYNFFKATNTAQQEPVPLPVFIQYGLWFQQNVVPDVDPTLVRSVVPDSKGFSVELENGRMIKAGRVIVSPGIANFAYLPDFALTLPIQLVSHTQDHKDFSEFQGRRVVVIGGGQSGLQTAAFLNEVGAETELIVRKSVIWINRKLYRHVGPIKHLFYPPSDVGPPGINWLIAFPQLYRCFSDDFREKVHRRAIRPSGAQWLRNRVENVVRTTEYTEITSAQAKGNVLHLTLSDGTTREVDHLILGTGYRASVDKLPFLDVQLTKQIQVRHGHPVLNSFFESSVPKLHFIGALAGDSFGPICRFVSGAKASAQQVARAASSN